MYDYGKYYRDLLINEDKIERRQKKQAIWLLLIATVYFIMHIAYYLWRVLL
jgi:hypothetical protein